MIQQYFGVETDYMVIALIVLVVALIITTIVNASKQHKLRVSYEKFMEGNDAKSLEDTLIFRLEQIDELVQANATNERNIDALFKRSIYSFQKIGLIKYDALEEMGGKLSFSLCMLDKENNGFILNAVHSREGCYSYIKEIIDGNAIVQLASEEEQALEAALEHE